MDKPVIIQFDKEAHKEYEELKQLVAEGAKSKKHPTHQQLLASINNALSNIKANYRYGDLIPRKYISKETARKYGADRIFRVELVGYWRLLYTVIGDEAKIIAFILEYMNHKDYNKIFGYKKR